MRNALKLIAVALFGFVHSVSAEGITREQGEQILEELRALRAAIERLAPARSAPQRRQRRAAAREIEVALAGGNRIGRADAPLTLVQYTDYQCPYCARFFRSTWPRLKAEYVDSGKLQMIVHDLPLAFHPNAAGAAHAARCAAEQGRFEAMHDHMYRNAQALSEPDLSRYASELDLDVPAFDACMSSGRYREVIDASMATLRALGITGTPTFVLGRADEGKVHGPVIVGAQALAVFRARIEALLAPSG